MVFLPFLETVNYSTCVALGYGLGHRGQQHHCSHSYAAVSPVSSSHQLPLATTLRAVIQLITIHDYLLIGKPITADIKPKQYRISKVI